MLRLLLVRLDKITFEDLKPVLKGYGDIVIESVELGETALKTVSDRAPDLVIIDEDLGDMTGIEFVRRLLKINPMIDSAVVSRLGHDEFHEASEGLGIMAQLPANPGREDAERLIMTLKQIKGMLV